ncbi:uncharacterized protein Bfra_005708 [Botrytis fragariae]|uniref:Uncharacterized protein n=1 Tax=Botrytis fragariae TaxID=1964551 RepID=A0A8H6ARL5_9HELO|nr:uncharacterized protein Bfra_005708 [Botrytis fragariae]KAF5872349.1 hypothetical protein Bfra_005708 [Botrytis fragariae]
MEDQETTSPCRGKSLGRSLSLVTDLAPPSQQPCPTQHSQNPQNLNSAYPVSAPPLAHHNQINPLSALPLTQNHPFAIPQPQPYQAQLFNPEHHYLLLSLSRENFKALSLRQKIAAAETSLASIHLAAELEGTGIGITSPLSSISTPTTPHSAPTRRKLKKQISWLKCRIKECTRQERILMERLQQIGEEEERRWRWMQIEQQRRINEEMMEWQRGYWNCFVRAGGAIGQGGCAYSGGGYGHGGMLNASTPAFQPVGGVSFGGACSGDSKASVGGRKYSNEFWNTDAPVFSPVNFFKPSSSSISVSTSTAPSGLPQKVQNGEVERLSRGWDECELSPLAEERRGSSLRWSMEIRGGDKEGNEMEMGEEGEGSGSGSGSGEGEAGDSSTETAITTPTPQQSARMSPMGGAKSCNDVMLAFFDGAGEEGVDGEGKRGLCGKEGGKREKKSKSLPGLQRQRWEGVCGGKGKLYGKEVLKERNEIDQVW